MHDNMIQFKEEDISFFVELNGYTWSKRFLISISNRILLPGYFIKNVKSGEVFAYVEQFCDTYIKYAGTMVNGYYNVYDGVLHPQERVNIYHWLMKNAIKEQKEAETDLSNLLKITHNMLLEDECVDGSTVVLYTHQEIFKNFKMLHAILTKKYMGPEQLSFKTAEEAQEFLLSL